MLGWLDQKQSVSVATEEIYVCLRVVPSRCSLFVIAMKRRQPKCPSTAEWKHTVWPIHAVEYYLAIKRNRVLIHVITWMNLKNMLNERSQSQRPHIVSFHLYDISRTGTFIETDSRFVVA